jgi:hypothetical protein
MQIFEVRAHELNIHRICASVNNKYVQQEIMK